ncbi:hypothetical protein JF550_09080 [Microbacterium esteraromaticum]|uniref:Lipoprotein n=1 Tax=Microbacterium esteraromaticum TaxID=57043 RepID=A0A939DVM8_9MICO|nr:hypothetical protein [Microbacterium esteraromaticum]MBN8206110.1 hypothetical protein [Microbacterium esteraromaticum]MBN8416265.1 hypothetical protein [Microbacterium esteraromaticum]
MTTTRRRLTGSLTAGAAVLLLALTGCSASATPPAADDSATTKPTATSPAPSPTTSSATPQQSFLDWLAASREPNADVACAYLSDALVERMLAEMKASGFPVSDCAEMTNVTAQAYAATGNVAEVDIETVSEEAQRAELFVTYAGGSCGTVVLEPGVEHWIMTEQSKEQC